MYLVIEVEQLREFIEQKLYEDSREFENRRDDCLINTSHTTNWDEFLDEFGHMLDDIVNSWAVNIKLDFPPIYVTEILLYCPHRNVMVLEIGKIPLD